MAQIEQRDGIYRILVKIDGVRRSITLGPLNERAAHDFADNVEHVVGCRRFKMAHAVDPKVWEDLLALAITAPEVYDRLAELQLVPLRQAKPESTTTIGQLVDDVLADIKSHRKLNTQNFYTTIYRQAESYWGRAKPVAAITPRDADRLLSWMTTREDSKVGQATLARRIKAYRYLFSRAIRWGMCTENHFTSIKAGGSVNESRKFYVPRDVFEAILAKIPDREFRAILALSRYGALRGPSEIVNLRWADVVWPDAEGGRPGKLHVRSPKTEHHAGGSSRTLPLFPELATILFAWYGEAPAGDFVVSTPQGEAVNWRTRFKRAIEAAGFVVWPKLFHNMRASRESELYRLFPLDTVCKWLGHRPEIAARHYLHDGEADENFRRAAGLVRPLVRAEGESTGNERTLNPENLHKPEENAENELVGIGGDCARRDSNKPQIAVKTAKQPGTGAPAGAPRHSNGDSGDFHKLEKIWPELPADVRGQILMMARNVAREQAAMAVVRKERKKV